MSTRIGPGGGGGDQAHVAEIWSRSGRDITAAYPELGVLSGRRGPLVLDGEIVVLSGARPDFAALQRRMTAGRGPGCSPRHRSR